jgi:pilus assembly protein CpaC
MVWSDPVPAQEPSPQPSALIVPINGTIKLQMSKKQKIRTVTNPKENAINIRTVVGDPTTILVIGQQPDVTRIELEDTDGNKETYEVIVQADIEYLRTQMKRAIPTANVTPIPTSNNTVILSGTVTRAEDVSVIRGLVQSVGFRFIDAMRVGGVQQVQLDVIVAEVSRTDLRAMGFNILGSGRGFFTSNTTGNTVAQPATVGSGAPFSSGGAILGTPGTANGNPTNLLLGVVHNTWGLQNYLQLLHQNQLLKLLAEPRLTTLSGRPASFLVGGEQAIPVPAGLGQIGVQFEEFGTRLNFIPIVLGNGRIHLEVEPEVSNLDSAAGVSINGTTVPGRATNRVNTTVDLESGQSFVIGGLIQHQVQASINKIPCLGDMPYFGAFFRNVEYQDTEKEVLVIVTPWLVDPESCDQRAKMMPGEETRNPDNSELILEGIIEAPRGPRQPWQNHHYVPAWKNSPSAAVFPCAGKGYCGVGGCGVGACGASCGAGGCAGAAGDSTGFGPTNGGATMQTPASLMTAPPATATPPAAGTPPTAAGSASAAPTDSPVRQAGHKELSWPPLNDMSASAPPRGQP